MLFSKKDLESTDFIALADAGAFFCCTKSGILKMKVEKIRKEIITMIKNPKIGQKVWFLEPWGQCIHSAKITALGETEVSVRNPEKYPYADIEWDDGGNSGCLLKNLYTSREELQKEIKKEEEKKIAEIKAKIKDANDLVAFMYDHCVACAEEYTDWTARRAVKEIAKEMLGLDL